MTKIWSFSISPSSDYSQLISLKIDLFWSPCCSRDSQESSPAPWFKGINSLALDLLYDAALTTVHDHWEDHSCDLRTFVSRVMSLLLTHLGHHKALDRDPCTIQQGLIPYFIHSISSVYMSIPVSQFILPHAFPLGVGMFVFYVCVSASAL